VWQRSRRTRQLQSVSMYHGQFLTPIEFTPLDRSPKILLLVITSSTANFCAKFGEKSVHGGLLGKWEKYNNFLFIIPAKAFARDHGITGVRLSVCLSVDGSGRNFFGMFLGGKASPSSFSVTIASRVWRLLSKNAVNRGFFQCKQTNKSVDA